MPWNDISPAIGVDKPIRASTHLAVFQNFAAMANGEPGAPRIIIPGAVATPETDTAKVLKPDGNGGVTWSIDSADGRFASGVTTHSSSDLRIPVTASGTFLVFGKANQVNFNSGDVHLIVTDGVVVLAFDDEGGRYDGTYLRRYINSSSGQTDWWRIRLS